MRETPKPMQVYRHFKGNMYQIVTVAEHTETGEKLVIYRPIDPDCKDCGSRPDTEEKNSDGQPTRIGRDFARPLDMFLSEVDRNKYPHAEYKYRFTLIDDPDNCAASSEGSEDAGLDPMLEKFLDADSYEEKLEIFYDMKGCKDKQILSYIATSLDIVLSSEEVSEQYDELLKCLVTLEKYECNRLRRGEH